MAAVGAARSRMLPHVRRASTLLRPHLPVLNAAPLLKPRIARVDWEVRQEFSREDDPDRTAPEHDWATPAFIGEVDPSRRARQTVATDLDVAHVQGARRGFSFARAVDGVLTESVCVDICGP